MKVSGTNRMLILVLAGIGLVGLGFQIIQRTGQASEVSFVTREGSKLLLDGQTFRFGGANIYWLGLDENVNGVNYPSEFRVDNALATAQMMGLTVVRSHAAASVGCELCIEPKRGIFNETALRKLDYALKSARDHNIRLILMLCDNYEYYHGGLHDFAGWHGLPASEFYTDPRVIDDFKQYVSVILNRVNTYTGIAYKDDPYILAWETGNEIRPPVSWTATISSHIKQLAPKHLVIDGTMGVKREALSLPDVDIYSDHYYPLDTASMSRSASLTEQAGKAFVIGEYDWNDVKGGDRLDEFLAAVEGRSAVTGTLFWALFGHRDDHGYVHSNGGYKLHYPGSTPEMREKVALLAKHAVSMLGANRSATAAAVVPPGVPLITATGSSLAWRGVAGADTYTIERSSDGKEGPWSVVCNRCTSDADPPWVDPDPPEGRVWYRMRAVNLAGVAGAYSEPMLAEPAAP